MIRDEEIKRLVFYAKSLGAKVIIRHYKHEFSGEVTLEPKFAITVNKKYHQSKTDIILTLLHELSHVKYTVLNDYKFSNSFLDDVFNKKIPKKLRKDIVEFELASLELMPNIASEVQIKVPMKKILIQKELDQWTYKYLNDHGVFPTEKLTTSEKRKLSEKYNK